MIKIGLNGFGRIGRALTRIISESSDLELLVINDIDADISNLAYLIKYDSIYGNLKFPLEILKNQNAIKINNKKINFFSYKNINEVKWNEFNLDLVIDATGVESNTINAKKIINEKLKKVIITHSPDDHIDKTIIMGVNEDSYEFDKHHIISSSICDASAIAPVLYEIDKKFGIKKGYATTLHPRLSYQNLLDGSLRSVSNPGHNWKNYSLGRDSISNLIPKNTTAVKAVVKCIKNLNGKLDGMSFRVPTSIVCASDLTIELKKDVDKQSIHDFFKNLSKSKNKIFEFQEESLVSSDYIGTNKSVIIDSNFINVLEKNLLKIVIWYDNEWGYSNRVIDIAKHILNKNE